MGSANNLGNGGMGDKRVQNHSSTRTASTRTGLPQGTEKRLLEFQRRVRVIKIVEGLFAGLCGFIISYLLVFVLDRFIDTPAMVRGLILIGGTIGLGILFPLKCHKWVWGTRRMEQVAGLVRHNFPRLGDQLLGVVELALNERQTNESFELKQAAIEQVDASVKDRSLADAVPNPRHRFWLKTAAVPAGLMLLCLVLVPAAGANALGRWLAPWRDIDRFTFAQIDQLPEEIVVPHGEEFPLTATLSGESQWSPSRGTLIASNLRETIQADLSDNQYQFLVPPLTSTADLNVRIGDFRDSVRIRPETRPELSEMQAVITLPDYLNYSKPVETDVRGGVISIVKGSTAEFAATISRELDSASVGNQEARVDGNRILASAINVAEPETIGFRWKDRLGLSAKDNFKLKINAISDAEPAVSCVQVEPHQVVLSTEVINFEIAAVDDFGLKRIGLHWSGIHDALRNPEPEEGEKLVEAGDYEITNLNAVSTFCAESDKVRPQTIQVRAFAEDYRPDGERAYSPAYILHVMTPQDHAIWIANQMRRWASLADDVYEEEIRLHDENRALRRLDDAELRQQATQRRIKRQASSEKANAIKLDAVTTAGEQLIAQAVKNPEMLVGHLETWADALKQLREMSDKRMPSIADLLNDASKAKSVPKPPSAGSENKSQSAPQVGNNRNQQKGGAGEGPPKKSGPKAPSISDIESGFNKPNEEDPEEKKDQEPSPPSTGKFGLPTTVLQGGPPGDKKEKKPDQPKEQVDEAVELQAGLLDDFNKIRDQLQEILDDLENSTFVKRFKAASRKQLEIAKSLNRTLFKGFGVTVSQLEDRQNTQMTAIAENEVEQSRNAWNIQSDLEAYYGRKRDPKMLTILEEMKELETVDKLEALGDRVRENLAGESIVRAEYWADTFDRWGEELVKPSNCGQCKGCNGESLPPSIVLEVMRILEAEIDLREETRSLEQSKAVMETVTYDERSELQSETQDKLHERTMNVMTDIRAIPEGEAKFGKELYLISMAANAMDDATKILAQHNTGPDAIGAETEAIEWLLQSKRSNPNGGGGSGGSTPGGGGGGDTTEAALASVGPGNDPNAKVQHRDVEQSSGITTDRLPEEFRDGLDAFFNALENRGTN